MVKYVVKHIFDRHFLFSIPSKNRTVKGLSTVGTDKRQKCRLCSQTTRATNCATPRKRQKTRLPKTACLQKQTGFSDLSFYIISCLFPKVKIFWLLFPLWCSWHGWTKNTLFFCACLKGRENGEGGKAAREAWMNRKFERVGFMALLFQRLHTFRRNRWAFDRLLSSVVQKRSDPRHDFA